MKHTINLKLPSIPNFILAENDIKFDIAAISDSDLRKIARTWSKELVGKAQKRRQEIKDAVLDTL